MKVGVANDKKNPFIGRKMKGVFQCFKRFFHNRSELGEEDFYPFRRDWYHDQIDDLSYDYTEYSGNRREMLTLQPR